MQKFILKEVFIMVCKTCGKEIPNGANVCPLCGTPAPQAAPQAAAQPAPQAAPQPQQAPPYAPPVAPQAAAPAMAPETTKPRSAYWAAILHLVLGYLGLGYYYRGQDDKAKKCLILFFVGVFTSWLAVGTVLILIVEILNLVEAIKLFKGDYPVDEYGRKLYLEF